MKMNSNDRMSVTVDGAQLPGGTPIAAESDPAVRFEDMTEDEQIEAAAARILKRFKPAFEELAK